LAKEALMASVVAIGAEDVAVDAVEADSAIEAVEADLGDEALQVQASQLALRRRRRTPQGITLRC
jgi:hypothetical protein